MSLFRINDTPGNMQNEAVSLTPKMVERVRKLLSQPAQFSIGQVPVPLPVCSCCYDGVAVYSTGDVGSVIFLCQECMGLSE